MAVGTRRLLTRPNMLYRPMSLLGYPSATFASTAFCYPTDNHIFPVDAIPDSSQPDFSTMRINLANQVEIRFKKDTNLSLFHDKLVESSNNNVTNVQFFTITGSRIPLSERVSDLREYPVLLQVNNDKVFALNFTDEFKVEREASNDIKEEEHYYDFAKGVGLKDYEKFFFPNFAHHVQHALPQKKELLTSQEVANSLALCLRYYTDKGFTKAGLAQSKAPIQEITKRLAQLQSEFGPN